MTTDESRELASARKLLSEFEADMASPGAPVTLAEALSFLAEAFDDAASAESLIARNIAARYAEKTAAGAEAVLDRTGEPSRAELEHWKGLFTEFSQYGIESAAAESTLSKLNKRVATRYVSQLTPSEKVVLLKKLEAEYGEDAKPPRKRG